MVIPDAPTPEAAAYLGQKDATEHEKARFYKKVIICLVIFLVLAGAVMVYTAITSSQVKTTVDNHTTTLARQAGCQDKAYLAIIKDVRLAFKGDKNPADYARAPKSC